MESDRQARVRAFMVAGVAATVLAGAIVSVATVTAGTEAPADGGPRPDLAVQLSVTRPLLGAVVTGVHDPREPFTLHIHACNIGAVALTTGHIDAAVVADAGLAPVAGPHERAIGTLVVPRLAPGNCLHDHFYWMPDGAVGDVTFRAVGEVREPEARYANNVAEDQHAVWLSGHGGVLVPEAATASRAA